MAYFTEHVQANQGPRGRKKTLSRVNPIPSSQGLWVVAAPWT